MRDFAKVFFIGILLVPSVAAARNVVSRAAKITNTPTSGYTYNYMYPYLNNQMRDSLNPGNTNDQSTSPINAVVRTSALPGTKTTSGTSGNGARRVVARTGRVGTSGGGMTVSNPGVARAGVGSYNINNNAGGRRVAQRGSVVRATRNTAAATTASTVASSGGYVSSGRCLADYTECMNSYCVHGDAVYNRCFCSSRLSQIESTYQTQIDSLIKQILRAKDTTTWTDQEMAEYWDEKVGRYLGENTWEKLDDALNIDWPDAAERMRGQNAYLTGHQYCINHLTNCAYVSANIRDVYRSEISRDCDAYEQSLDKLKTALESALETYSNN